MSGCDGGRAGAPGGDEKANTEITDALQEKGTESVAESERGGG